MKKNISINISGIIFHIEEDGYEQLKTYLDSISKYFSSFEDSKEIIADIENRIAEIFSEKLNEVKQVITAEDVTALIGTMGTVSDFKAIEEEMDKATEPSHQASYESGSHTNSESTSKTSKKLFRDAKRKILGGVASGIAHYMGADPLWIRLAFLALLLGLFFIPALSGLTAITYIILWIVLPESSILEESETYKKLYRNPDERIISGVCSGIAAYFGVDVTLIRLLFVIGIFLGGSTIILYLILMLITPEAKTITEKIQMQGEPVTLSNIENNIKKNLNVKEGEENTLTKILLFPFRFIAIVFTALAKAIGPILSLLAEIIRIALGVILVFVPVVLFIVLFAAMGIIFGVIEGHQFFSVDRFPLEIIVASIPKLSAISVFFLLAIPVFAMGLLGTSLLAKRKIFSPILGFTLLGLFIISIFVTTFTLPSYITNFKREARFEETNTYSINAKTVILRPGEDDQNFDYNRVELKLRGHEGNDIKVVKRYFSRGKTKKDALQNAHMIEYNILQQDSVLVFDHDFNFKENALFRGQNLEVILYIPYGKEFIIEEGLGFYDGHHYREAPDNKWVFGKSGEMKCITCNEEYENEEYDEDFDFYNDHYKDNDSGFSFHFDTDFNDDNSEKIEAEDYFTMSGVEKEGTEDVGGGENLGFIDDGDWMAYKVTIPKTGIYTVKYRISSQDGNGKIRMERYGDSYKMGTISIPQTHSWQNWKTISQKIKFHKGSQKIVLVAEEGGFNLNWFSITPEDKTQAFFNDKKSDNSGLTWNSIFEINDTEDKKAGTTRTYRLTDFTGLSISGFFLINVLKGDHYKLSMKGNDDKLDEVEVSVKDGRLSLDMDSDKHWTRKDQRIKVDIVMPELKNVDFEGLTKSTISGFDSDYLSIHLNGASTSDINIIAHQLDLDVSGGAQLKLKGKADFARVELDGATDLTAFDFKIKRGEFDISGASTSKIFATDLLKINADGPCLIRYRGHPKLEEHSSFLSKIQKDN